MIHGRENNCYFGVKSHCSLNAIMQIQVEFQLRIFGQPHFSHVEFVYRSPLTICPFPPFVLSLLQVPTRTVNTAQGVGLSCQTAETCPWRRPGSTLCLSRIKGIETTEGEAPGNLHLNQTGSKLVDSRQREGSKFMQYPTRRAQRLQLRSGGVSLKEKSKHERHETQFMTRE